MNRYSGTVKAGGIATLLEGKWDKVIIGSCSHNRLGSVCNIPSIYGQYFDAMGIEYMVVKPTLSMVRRLVSGTSFINKNDTVLWLCDCDVSIRKISRRHLWDACRLRIKCYGIVFEGIM